MYSNILRQSAPLLRGIAIKNAQPSTSLQPIIVKRSIHFTPIQQTWGGGKMKSHSGASKRFFPVGKRTVINKRHHLMQNEDFLWNRIQDKMNGLQPQPLPQKKIGVMFKRGQTGMRHLNSKMQSLRRMRLRGTVIERSGPKVKVLSRLIGNRK